MTDTLLAPTTVYRIGRARTQHSWSVHVVGDDTIGYRVQVRTRCGIVVSGNDDAKLVEGFATCTDCEVPAC